MSIHTEKFIKVESDVVGKICKTIIAGEKGKR